MKLLRGSNEKSPLLHVMLHETYWAYFRASRSTIPRPTLAEHQIVICSSPCCAGPVGLVYSVEPALLLVLVPLLTMPKETLRRHLPACCLRHASPPTTRSGKGYRLTSKSLSFLFF